MVEDSEDKHGLQKAKIKIPWKNVKKTKLPYPLDSGLALV